MTQQAFYVTDPDTDEKVKFTLHSLSEYEAFGIYSDAGNGGEDMRDEKDRFIAAISVDPATLDGLEEGAAIKQIAGVEPDDLWLDSATGWWLLRDWPANAPLQARMVGE